MDALFNLNSLVIFIFLSVFLDGLIGLIGGLLPFHWMQRNLQQFLAFAAGTLLGVAFFELLPEAFHLISEGSEFWVLFAILIGFVGFYSIQTFLGSHAAGQGAHEHSQIGPLILVGDALHNITDGVAIATAYLTSVYTGISATLAVLIHELPQEIGDYALLVAHGYSRKKALLSLMVVQLSAFIGAIVTLCAFQWAKLSVPYLLACSAGGFIYIAAADLLPHLTPKKLESKALKWKKLFWFLLGIGTIVSLKFFVHGH